MLSPILDFAGVTPPSTSQRAGDITCLIRGEECEDIGDLLRRGAAAQRDHAADRLLLRQRDGTVRAARPGRVHRAGADAIGADAIGRLLQGNALGEGVEKPLGAAIRREVGGAVEARFRSRIDNVATGLAQVRQRRPGHQERGAHIVAQCAVEVFDAVIVRPGIGDEDARIAHQNIDPVEAADRQIDQRLRLRVFRQVAGMDFRHAAIGDDMVRDILHGIVRQAAENKTGTLAGEFLRDRLANAGSRARDDRNLAVQHHGPGSFHRWQ